jgi:hypothetical protein
MMEGPPNASSIEAEKSKVSFSLEKFGDISLEQEEKARLAIEKSITKLQDEYHLSLPVDMSVYLMSDEKFREGAKENDPASWKYCFLLRDQGDGRVYINADIFNVLPDSAESIVKHELAHIVTGQLVGNVDTYKKSFILEEGMAGLDNATQLLVSKLKKENSTEIPNPLDIKTLAYLKSLGADTNIEPFTEQLPYLVLFSFLEFLKEKNGTGNMIEVYKKLESDVSLEDAYKDVCGGDLVEEEKVWREKIVLK